jgi:surfactin synthase thioesterase subunit
MYSFAFVRQIRSPLFVVCGSQDPFCSADQKNSLFESLRDDRDWKVLEGADHFFWNYEKEAAQYLCQGFDKWMKE